MISTFRPSRLLVYALAISGAVGYLPTYAADAPAKKAAAAEKTPAAKPAPAGKDAAGVDADATVEQPSVPHSNALAAAIAEYKEHPDPVVVQKIWKELHDLVVQPTVAHASAQAILSANPALTDIGAKLTDASGARVWSLPKVQESQSVLLQWQNAVGPPTKTVVGKGRHRKIVFGPAPTVTKTQFLPVPTNILFRDARILHSSGAAAPHSAAKAAAGKGNPQPAAPHAEGPRVLALLGNERVSGTIWLQAFRLNDGVWQESQTALTGIPPYLVQSVSGRAYFQGNDVVLALGAGGGEPGGTSTSGYKIALKLVDGKFTIEGKALDQGPSMAVLQFVQALQQNRIDIARAWLYDPKLISIPKYIGLLNRSSEKPYKVIAMSAPFLSGARFRVMTGEKDDLIVDVGKVKLPTSPQPTWAIKGLFIAPPDPLAAKLGGTLTTPGVEAKPPAQPAPPATK